MKYLIFLAFSLSVITWMACGHGRPAETSETTPGVIPTNSTVPSQTIPVNLDEKNTATTPLTITPSGTAATGLNPEHGKPGHRCDIAVGAPLNSAPVQQSTPAISAPVTTPVNISPDKLSQPVTSTKVAPGMNPAHGEPGHRCDIAVGAPLDSKPTTPVTTTTSDQTVKPAATTPAKVAPGMNPAHGEPGHRCDIGVGEPLNSPVKPDYTPPAVNKPSIPSVVPIKPVQEIKKNNR